MTVALEDLTKGLTPTQKKAFMRLLKKGSPSNSYGLGVKITTMRALEKKGLVKGKWSGVPVEAEINYKWHSLYKKAK